MWQCNKNTWMSDWSPAANRLSVDNNIHPLLDSSEFSISRNFAIAQLAASVLWLLALFLISETISLETCWQNDSMSQNFSFISLEGLVPKT